MSRQSKNISKARKVVKVLSPFNDPQQVIDIVRHDIPNARLNNCKYLTGITRMYLNNEFCDQKTAKKINDTIKLIASAHFDEYDNDLNGMTANAIVERFKTEVDVELKSDVKLHNATQFIENKQYKIYRIDSFEEASKFSPYTSWCVTKNEESYDLYASNGYGLFYFCVRDDFKAVKAVPSEGCPLDDYGLSMIATSVDDDGRCNTITCRWNHDNNGNDGIMTPMQLSKLIGRNYYQVFKPYTKEELYAKGLIPTEDVQILLDKGKKPSEIFSKMLKSGIDGILIVSLNEKKWNLFDTSKNMILCSEWYGYVGYFHDGFAVVRRGDDKWNFIKPDGSFLCSEWYKDTCYFYNGFARVQRDDGIWNLIKPDGSVLCSEWYKDTDYFYNGFARVQRDDGKWNFIKSDGSVLCSEWYKSTGNFHDGFAFVRRGDGKWNFIKSDESVLCDEWYDLVYDFRNGFAVVRRGDGKWNFIKPDGKVLCSEWYNYTGNFIDGFAKVRRGDGKCNLIKPDGKLLCSEWYKDTDYFYNGFARVQRDDGIWNLIKPDGKLLCSEWYDLVYDFIDGFARVQRDDGIWNLINEDGCTLSPEWFAITFEDDTDKIL